MAKQKTHEEFMKKFKTLGNQNIIILGRYIGAKTKILVKCTIDGHEWYATPSNLLKGRGCPICSGKQVVKEINSIAAKRPDLLVYFVNKDDAYKATCGCRRRLNLKCPDCGTFKSMAAYNLTEHGFSCQVCGDGISYPNKLIRQVMKTFEQNLDFLDYEWTPNWSNGKRYDVCFLQHNKYYTIEMQGAQHYTPMWYSDKSVAEIMEEDYKKSELAKAYGVTPIVIDARISDPNFIISNIKSSILSELFDFSVIDWDKCIQDAVKNIVKQVCDDYNKNPNVLTSDLAKKYKIHRRTVSLYLKQGNEFGWCKYSPEESYKNAIVRMGKAVHVFDKNKNLTYTYCSVSECCRELSKIYNCYFNRNIVNETCNGIRDSYYNLIFEYT